MILACEKSFIREKGILVCFQSLLCIKTADNKTFASYRPLVKVNSFYQDKAQPFYDKCRI